LRSSAIIEAEGDEAEPFVEKCPVGKGRKYHHDAAAADEAAV